VRGRLGCCNGAPGMMESKRMHRIILALLLASLTPCSATVVSDHNQGETAAPVRTGKERLSDKASDEQRTNDCKVPPIKRTRSRPTSCR
jgi:hypothetical protein